MRVTVYTKPGCHLCEDALFALDRLTSEYGLQVEEVNILDSIELHEAFKHDIPVMTIEGGRLGAFKAPLDEGVMRAAFNEAQRTEQERASGKSDAARSGMGVVPRAPSTRGEPVLDRIAMFIGRNWLKLAIGAMLVYVVLPWLAPVFAAMGWWWIANPIYTAYALTCHQLPERAGNVMGYQVAFCYRNTALYGGVALFGWLYARARSGDRRLGWLARPLPWWGFVLLLLPMVVDGITHMLGLREAAMMDMDASFGSFYWGSQPFSLNWWLRIITGLIAALGAVWFAFPRMDHAVADSEALLFSTREQQLSVPPAPVSA